MSERLPRTPLHGLPRSNSSAITDIRKPAVTYAVALAALVAAVGLRWLIEPVMAGKLPFVTLCGAVAVAV